MLEEWAHISKSTILESKPPKKMRIKHVNSVESGNQIWTVWQKIILFNILPASDKILLEIVITPDADYLPLVFLDNPIIGFGKLVENIYLLFHSTISEDFRMEILSYLYLNQMLGFYKTAYRRSFFFAFLFVLISFLPLLAGTSGELSVVNIIAVFSLIGFIIPLVKAVEEYGVYWDMVMLIDKTISRSKYCQAFVILREIQYTCYMRGSSF